MKDIGILVDFKINQENISNTLCINIDTPISMCNGVCYISQIESGTDSNNQLVTELNQKVEISYFWEDLKKFAIQNFQLSQKKQRGIHFVTDLMQFFLKATFKPPQF